MTTPIKLSMEQQFELRSFELQVNAMSAEQAKAFLVELRTHMLCREAMYQEMLKNAWGLTQGDVVS